MAETIKCPKCGKLAIMINTGICFIGDPSQNFKQWWCACGYIKEGGRESLTLLVKDLISEWNKANGIKET